MAKFRYLEAFPEQLTAKVVGTTIVAGDPLKFVAGGVSVAGDGETVNAWAIEGGAAGVYIKCGRGQVRMIGKAAAATNFAIGDKVYLAASQELDAGSVNNKAVGEVVTSDPDSGSWVEILYDPNELTTHA